ncbi:heme-thiolate peroxidase [Agrocybe chaxingu]|uniref:Heme-thiolate peroxidase n=1 Tax=Agrocybe chaxingu TaxID=84603 RepID=A0A9W8TFW0_9AGAR|nr:heme-thiolate peroxidase [Agrocybe chaxingu]
MRNFYLLPTLVFAARVAAFPAYASLAGLSEQELDSIIPTLKTREPPPPPGPLEDSSIKLVNDEAHPWEALRPGDIRGPCPGLNTLASHGYLPRNGVATPAQIVTAAMEGFNFANGAAIFAAYGALLVDGNPITDLVSIGGKTPLTGPDTPPPAIVGGLNTHGTFEGDASLTRGDAFFGNNHDFNETLFEQLADFSNQFGGGKYNLTVAGEFKFKRIQDSIATNPEFSLVNHRYITVYGETTLPVNLLVDGRRSDGQLGLDDMREFFQFSRMPDGFFRANGPKSNEGIDIVIQAHPVRPGRNLGKVNSYTFDPTSADFSTLCSRYENFVNQTVKGLYPNPTGQLRKALNRNLDYLFQGVDSALGCTQVFPYGRD